MLSEMRWSVALLTLCIAHSAHSQDIFNSIFQTPGKVAKGASSILDGVFRSKTTDQCARDVSQDYRKAITDFHNKLYTHIAARSDNHFVFSPYTIWLSLSALAEGADPSVQSQIFTSLNLPQERCIRKKFYDIALNVEKPGRDVTLRRRRSLVLDESLKVYPSWGKMARSTGLLDFEFAPIKKDPKTTSQRVRKFLSIRSNIVLKGNSVLLDALYYQGLWTTAFPEAKIQSQPFFNELGQKIGTVDMMHMQKKVRLVSFLNAKVLELPVGVNGRYTMLIAVGTGNSILKNSIDIFMGSILEIFSLLKMSPFRLDVAIPRFAVSSEFDARSALEDIGIRSFWSDPAATRYVSNPPATPGGLIQRVSIKVDSQGVEPPPTNAVSTDLISGQINLASNTASSVATAVGHEFVADRPFLFALFDTDSRTCLFAGAYSRPNALK